MLKLPQPGDFFYPERRVTHRQVYIRCEWLRGLDNVHLCARDDNGDRKSPPRADLPGGIESRKRVAFHCRSVRFCTVHSDADCDNF